MMMVTARTTAASALAGSCCWARGCPEHGGQRRAGRAAPERRGCGGGPSTHAGARASLPGPPRRGATVLAHTPFPPRGARPPARRGLHPPPLNLTKPFHTFSVEEMLQGLDVSKHGERAYFTGDADLVITNPANGETITKRAAATVQAAPPV